MHFTLNLVFSNRSNSAFVKKEVVHTFRLMTFSKNENEVIFCKSIGIDTFDDIYLQNLIKITFTCKEKNKNINSIVLFDSEIEIKKLINSGEIKNNMCSILFKFLSINDGWYEELDHKRRKLHFEEQENNNISQILTCVVLTLEKKQIDKIILKNF